MPSPSTWLTVPSKRDSVHHDVQGRVQELPSLFLKPLDQLRRAFDVSEKDRDRLRSPSRAWRM
jgi:hypothetical protein